MHTCTHFTLLLNSHLERTRSHPWCRSCHCQSGHMQRCSHCSHPAQTAPVAAPPHTHRPATCMARYERISRVCQHRPVSQGLDDRSTTLRLTCDASGPKAAENSKACGRLSAPQCTATSPGSGHSTAVASGPEHGRTLASTRMLPRSSCSCSCTCQAKWHLSVQNVHSTCIEPAHRHSCNYAGTCDMHSTD